MRVRGFFRCLMVTCCILITSAVSHAQPVQPGSLPPIDAATRDAIVDSITAVIDSVYVLGEPAGRIVAEIRRALADGEYDSFTDPAAFAERLYEDCQRVNHDGHFRIFTLPPLDPAVVAAGQDEDPAEVELRKRYRKAINYGFKRAEILDGGVGYLRFDAFGSGENAFEAAAAAMNFISNSSAVILDLRQNGGGSGSMIRFICGYLFDEEQHLINWDIRAENKTVQSHSADYVPGRRLTEQPVYVLTSESTFSAAEEFTFDLKNLERATIVGDTTGGAGHTCQTYIFSFDEFRMGVRVPHGRAYNPVNNEGLEGVGIIPHIAVPAEQALDVAYADVLRNLLDAEQNERARAVYTWALQDVESRLKPVRLTGKQVKKYTGTFGPRRVFIKDDALWYQREDGLEYELVPMGEDLFRVGDLDFFRLSFGYDERGKVAKVIGLYSSGRRDENMKSGK